MTTTEWSWPGARWWRCDLHVHTPASNDYTDLNTATYADWAEGAVAGKVDVVAVTDHNSGDGIEPARREAEARGILVIPGVELTVSPGVHLLALFDPGQGRDDVVSLLACCGVLPAQFGEKDALASLTVEEAMVEARRLGALCILAHVDANNGVLKKVQPGLSLKRILKSRDLAAIEVKADDLDLLRFVDGRIPEYLPPTGLLTQVRSSDAHRPGDIGARFTWIKMTRPTIEGLRLALQDGTLSVRPHAPGSEPNEHARLVIESITVAKAKHIGRQAPLELRLNPWLNTLIGGRGTGKSSVVELLRAALRREQELPDSLRREREELVRVPETRGARGILTADTVVTVVYRKDGARFRVQWDPFGKSAPIEAEQQDGAWVASPGSVAERFPVRIYSQKQVYELTRDPEALLGIVDEAPEVGFREWQREQADEEARFLSLRAQAREIRSALTDEPRIRGELEDVQRRLAVFEGSGHAEVLKVWQKRRRQERAIDDWSARLGSAAEALAGLVDAAVVDPIDADSFDRADTADAALLDAVGAITRQVDQIREDARAIAARARATHAAWPPSLAASPWAGTLADATLAYDRLIDALKAAGGGDPSEYGRLVQQRQLLEGRLTALGGKRATLAALSEQASACLDRLLAAREQLSERRARFLAAVLSDNAYVRIELVPMGRADAVAGQLRGLVGRTDGAFQKDIGDPDEAGTLTGDLMSDYLSRFEHADAARRVGLAAEHRARLAALKRRLWGVHEGTVAAADKRFGQHMVARLPEQMDRLDAWFPPDALLVSFKGQGRGFQPINQGSPGQRSAALLAFLMAHGEEPIVLDQPEDDLDNQLVYDLIVKQLRKVKARRQVLVVTHNANIVVNGDAELVIALEVVNSQASASCSGGLQEQRVRDRVCQVMEGGAEAFRERYRRIAQRGGDV